MAKIEQMLRLKHIENFLRSRKSTGASYEEIEAYLEKKFAEKDLEAESLKFTKRTFLRDKEAISQAFGTEIRYRRTSNTYVIEADFSEYSEEDVFDNLLLVEAFREIRNRRDIMFFENRKSRGLHLLNGLIHSIVNRKQISFQYTKFWEGIAHRKVVEPYALKEFKHRWYLLANERDGETFFLKTFGLDRMQNLEISNSSFALNKHDVQNAFENSFGIISTLGEKPQEVILAFDQEQGNYIKALPLHGSQEIISESENETRVRLRLAPTYDFEREILSHGDRVKVISPKALRERLRKEVLRMLGNYEA